MVSRWQAMHRSTAARSAKLRGVNQRTLPEAQYSHFNMFQTLSTGRYVAAYRFGCLDALPCGFPLKHMTCHAAAMLRVFGYRIMTLGPNATILRHEVSGGGILRSNCFAN
jgi:hypothetical protein